MVKMIRNAIILLGFVFLASCTDSNSPGALEGKWQTSGGMKLNTEFRDGEVNEMGMISPASYEVNGNVVIMTYEGGIFKGNKIKYIVNGGKVSTAFGTMNRISQ